MEFVVVSGWTGAGKSTIADAFGMGHGARFTVIECVCTDRALHRSRVEGRQWRIPGWYELDWAQVERGRNGYVPLEEPKLTLDSLQPFDDNRARALDWLAG